MMGQTTYGSLFRWRVVCAANGIGKQGFPLSAFAESLYRPIASGLSSVPINGDTILKIKLNVLNK